MTTTDQPSPTRSERHFWERRHEGTVPDGADLARLRRGLGRPAGGVPEMWRYYTTLQRDGRESDRLRAEHAALCLMAIHQQSQSRLMHQVGIGLGAAMLELKTSGKFSAEAVDQRFTAAATATSFTEVVAHLRGLVTQLRTISQPLDYTRLFNDLVDWQRPEEQFHVRRRWGSQYYSLPKGVGTADQVAPATSAAS